MPPCQNKIKHPTLKSAREHLAHHRRTLQDRNLNVYWCEEHQAYHLGHKRRKR